MLVEDTRKVQRTVSTAKIALVMLTGIKLYSNSHIPLKCEV